MILAIDGGPLSGNLVLAVGSQVLASRLRIPALISLLPADFTAVALTTDVNPGRLLVPVDRAGSIAQFTAMVSAAPRDLPPGAWIVTSMGWHESFLAENRLPTGAELDAAGIGAPGARAARRAPGHRQRRRAGRGRHRAWHSGPAGRENRPP